MADLKQQLSAGEWLAAVVEDEAWRTAVVAAVTRAQQFARVGANEPFRALNYQGTTAWHEALNEVGKVLDPQGWKFNRLTQPTFTAPDGLFPVALDMWIFHGRVEGNEIHTAPRGRTTAEKIEANYQCILDFEEFPKVSPGKVFASLVMDRTGEFLRVYLAIARSQEGSPTKYACEAVVLLNETPVCLEPAAPDAGDTPGEVAPQISEVEGTG